MIGWDTEIAAVSAAISRDDRFLVCLERNAQCFKGSIQLAGRKKPIRHLVALWEEFASVIPTASGRTLLVGSDSRFVWASIAYLYGIPGLPEWAQWFIGELKTHHALAPGLGIECRPVIVSGEKEQVLDWLSWRFESGAINFSDQSGPIHRLSCVSKTSSVLTK